MKGFRNIVLLLGFVLTFILFCGKPKVQPSLSIRDKTAIELDGLETAGDKFKKRIITVSATHPYAVRWSVSTNIPNCVEYHKGTSLYIRSLSEPGNEKLCDVTVTVTMRGLSDSVKFSVNKPRVRGLKLSRATLDLETTGSFRSQNIVAIITPKEAANKNIDWITLESTNCALIEGKSKHSGKGKEAPAGLNTTGRLFTLSSVKHACTETVVARTQDGGLRAAIDVTVAKKYEYSKDFVSATLGDDITNKDIVVPLRHDYSFGRIQQKFLVGKTEITYKLWKQVYDWATDLTRPQAVRYTFLNPGQKGGLDNSSSGKANNAGSDKQPVSNITWCDAMVWSNAYTEWNNAKGSNLTIAYKDSAGQPIRSSKPNAPLNNTSSLSFQNDPAVRNCYTASPDTTATGFRLPTAIEWEYSARLTDNIANTVPANPAFDFKAIEFTNANTNVTKLYYFTKATLASGATEESGKNPGTRAVAWFDDNSCKKDTATNTDGGCTKDRKTHIVGTRAANTLGLFDMSGNVYEWVWIGGSKPKYYGGSSFEYFGGIKVSSNIHFNNFMQVYSKEKVLHKKNDIGFRVVKNE